MTAVSPSPGRALPRLPASRGAALDRAYADASRAKRARTLLAFAIGGLVFAASAVVAEVDPARLAGHIGEFFNYFARIATFDSGAPPDLRGRSVLASPSEWFWGLGKWVPLLLDTLLIAYVGTLLGGAAAFLLCFAAARNLSPNPLARLVTTLGGAALGAALVPLGWTALAGALGGPAYGALPLLGRAALPFLGLALGAALFARLWPPAWDRGAVARLLEVWRTVPELVFALIFVIAFGLGPLPGVLAIAIHTAGALGKLFAEVVENIDAKPLDGALAAGGNFAQLVRFAVLPQVLSNFASYALLRFEVNVRGAAVMGFVGAGGIGQDLLEAIRKFYYSDVSALLVLIVATVMLIDLGSERLRHALLGREARA